MYEHRARRRSGGTALLLTLGILLVCPPAIWSRKVRLTWVNGKLAEYRTPGIRDAVRFEFRQSTDVPDNLTAAVETFASVPDTD
jgi:hypothetical protein